ncbi:PAS domain-containing protein [Phycisphaeraceae bacterium AH-315-B13]|nr:PAS domain-containing protein [Phycisphaeraceae bacterium AH-315-B13]PHQ82287.1 MAG: hypothetical protein COB69_02250 [Phycisphaera sp.]
MSRFATIRFIRPTIIVAVALLTLGAAALAIVVLQLTGSGKYVEKTIEAISSSGILTTGFVALASLIGASTLLVLNHQSKRKHHHIDSLLSDIESDAFRSIIYDIDPSCMKILDRDGRILAINQSGLDIVQAESRDMVIGKLACGLVLPAHRQPYMDALRRTLDGEVTEIEYEIETLAGERVWLRQVAKSHYCSFTKQSVLYGISRDITDYKLNKDRLDLAIDVTNQGLWEEHLQTDQLFYNTNWYTMLGYTPDDFPMTSGSWRNLVHPDDIEKANADFQRHIDHEQDTYSSEYRMRAKDGTWKWIKDIGRIVERTDNGTPVRAIGLHIDIDATKRHELTLGAVVSLDATTLGTPTLTNLCRSIAEAYDLDCVGITKLIENDHGTVIAGWHDGKPTEPMTYNLNGTPCSVAIKSEYYHCESDVCNRFSDDTILTEMNADGYAGLALCGNDGVRIGLIYIVTKRPLHYSKELESSMRLVGARVAGEFERQHIEDSLQTSQDRLKLAMDAAKFGHWDWNANTDELSFSTEIYSMLGYDHNQHPDSRAWWRSICHAENANPISDLITRNLASNLQTFESEFRLRTADGSDIWVKIVGILEEEGGIKNRFFGTIQDITESKNNLVKLVEARDAAEAASRAKSEFLANMSHEIRTPMTAILGNADLLANNPMLSDEPELLKNSINAISRNADHLMSIINDILDTSKIDAGMLNIEAVEIAPYDLITKSAEMLSSRANDKGIDLSVKFMCEFPRRIESDPTRIRQIIINLIGNAIKFTDKGSVRVEIGYNPLPNRSGLFTITVIDTGIGIIESNLESLRKFEPFNQADGSTTRKFGGTGLGLRITNELTKMFGGTLTLKSEYGVGTTATATLQVKPILNLGMWHPPAKNMDRNDKCSANSIEQVASVLDGKTILLVEDGEDNRLLLNHMLRAAGIRVVNAVNGADAIGTYKSTKCEPDSDPFDLILMDMQMPEVDGYNATTILRGLGYIGPVIALTAHAMAGDREKCLAAGCHDYLTKPVRSATLLEMCAKHIGFRIKRSKAA